MTRATKKVTRATPATTAVRSTAIAATTAVMKVTRATPATTAVRSMASATPATMRATCQTTTQMLTVPNLMVS